MKTKFTFYFIAFAACIIITQSSKAQVNKKDSLALVNLYNATDGPNWFNKTNWLSLNPVKTWFGISLDDSNKRVILIGLPSNNLKGKLPTSIGNLTYLQNLFLENNLLKDTIPSGLGNLLLLNNIDLSYNQLSGSIPSEIGNLSNLNYVDLSYNQLNGNIPPQLGNLTNLIELKLGNNKLISNIPLQLGNLSHLTALNLSHNKLSGNIPREIGFLRLQTNTDYNDAYLDLSNNQLSGNIPLELSYLSISGNHSAYLNLSNNQLSGTIPREFGYIRYVSQNGDVFLDLSSNQLSGSIPPELGNIYLWGFTGNVYLNLSNNQLSGSIPPELGNLQLSTYWQDVSLNLSNNQLSGKIPAELGNLVLTTYSATASLNLSNNQLSGKIPTELGNLRLNNTQSEKISLNLSNNHLSGAVPSSLASALIDSLNLSYNRFKFDGMELIAQELPWAKYSHQKIIAVHLSNNSLSVSAGGTLSNNKYHWHKVGEPGAYNFAGDSVFYPFESGNYYVRVTNKIATNLTLSSDTVTYTAPTLSNAVSIHDALTKNLLSVYPNPATDVMYVRTGSNASFSLLDQSGKTLLTKNINKTGNIKLSQFSAGEYYLKNNNTNEIIKVIILK